MPGKKKQQEEELPMLMGRLSTNIKIGIVGLPNVGKSTFFNVMTKSAAPAENFPFCTIDPNEARVAVPDDRWRFLCDYHKPASKVPAYLNVLDIAGLVKGASEGQGLGNAFLSHIKQCDAIFHMSRAFEDEDVTHVEGDVDPVRDLDVIFHELRAKDLEQLNKRLEGLVKQKDRDKQTKAEYECLVKVKDLLDTQAKPVRFGKWDNKEIEILNEHLFITSKPIIYLINLSEKDYIRKKNKWLLKIKQWIDENDPRGVIIPWSAALETQLVDMSPEETTSFLQEKNATSALDKIITNGFKALHLEYFFTAGSDEVKAWTIKRGTKAPQAAGRIHTDFEKGFIMAEVMKFVDFKEAGSENATRAAGKYLQKGREYVVQDGDIIFFKFNTAGLKK
ncbi:obg-like ATPase 1 [Watersipora subatra]|uniref:obg-like ATPase 1 n=1 Tax=Watersipora subatra TaxID=2589382 RepID=UPI00355B1263